MKKFVLSLAIIFCAIATLQANTIQTIIIDKNSQPMLVGGYIDNYSEQNISKKGIIVSISVDDMIITTDTEFEKAEMFLCPSESRTNNPHDLRVIDCTNVNKEQFACALQFLNGNTDYYVKAFVIDKDNNVYYGDAEKVHTQDYNRYDGYADYANVYYYTSHTLFDLVTDEIIDINDGYYATTNESPKNVSYRTSSNGSAVYKLATEWNYKLWYSQVYNGTIKNNNSKIVRLPVMEYANGQLKIEKNPLDNDKDITIYYNINGNYLRPETYTDIYSAPLEISEPCVVYCYAISSEGYISYTNLYSIDNYTINHYKSLDDYIAISDTTIKDDGVKINPIIPNVKRIYIDLTKGTTNAGYCYSSIYSYNNLKTITYSSKFLESTTSNNIILTENNIDNILNIKNLADNKTYSWLYYNPQNPNEVIIDAEEYFGCLGYIADWQINFGTSCVVNIVTSSSENNLGKVADMVDLGLSVKWASWNVGAIKIADYGGLYGAGDPTGLLTSTSYDDYHWVEGENISGSEYDLAHVKWGKKWQLPTSAQLQELKEKCTWEHNVTIDDVIGSVATGPNGNTIFFPYAGCRDGSSNPYFGKHASLWASEAFFDVVRNYKDMDINLPSGSFQFDGCKSYCGQSIRPVYNDSESTMNNDSTKRTIHVATAGTLPDLISESEKYSIEELTLTGELNGTDLRLLRDMAGCLYLGEETMGKLKVLDLSNVKIVKGGDRYIDENQIPDFGGYLEQDDVFPKFVFSGCKFTSFIIPNSVSSIGNCAFSACSGLTSITIPNSVTSIKGQAFEGCSGLTSLIIPSSVQKIGYCAFNDCKSITSIEVDSSNPIYDSRNNCNAIIETATNTLIKGCDNTIIPNTINSIKNNAFGGCTSLTSISIPNSVTSIGEAAFYYSGITSIIIPNSVTSIGGAAFWQCNALKSVKSRVRNPFMIGYNVFVNIPKDAELTVPYGTKSRYETTEGWNVFSKITEDNQQSYNLTMKTDGHGSILYEGESYRDQSQSIKVLEGSNVIISISPDNGYSLASIKMNNTDVTAQAADNKYTIGDFGDDTEIEVSFVLNINEQYNFIYVDTDALGVSSEYTELAGGTSIGSISSMDAAIAFTDSYRSISHTSKDYPYIFINGKQIPNNGITGKLNPKDNNGLDPAISLNIPVSGNAYTIKAKKDGYMYVWGEFALNNSYLLFEESTAMGYQIAMNLVGKNSQDSSTGSGTGTADLDITSRVSTNGWGQSGFVASWAAPEVTTADGRSSGMAEIYRGSNDGIAETGVLMQQTVEVENGNYVVELYANSIYTPNRGFESDMEDGATDVAYVFANEVKVPIVAKIGETIPENGIYTLKVEVKDGSLTLGFGKEKAGTNWHTIQIKSLTLKRNKTTDIIDEKLYFQYGDLNKALTKKVPTISQIISGDFVNLISEKGDGVMVFPVRANKTYTICGSRTEFLFSGIHFNESMASTIQIGNENGQSITLLSPNDNPAYYSESIVLSIKATGNGAVIYGETNVRNDVNTFEMERGTSATISLIPDEGYKVKNLNVNNTDVTSSISNNQYIISNINANTNVEAEFEAIQHTLSIKATGNGSVSYGGTSVRGKTSSFTVIEGTSVDLIITPDDGHLIKSVIVNNTDVTANIVGNQYSINDIYNDITVEAQFNAIETITYDGLEFKVSSTEKKEVVVAKADYGLWIDVPETVSAYNVTWTVTGFDDGAFESATELAAVIWNPQVIFKEKVTNPNLLLYVSSENYASKEVQNVIVNGKAKSIKLIDAVGGNNFYCPQDFTAEQIIYEHNYSMKTGYNTCQGWETIVLPYDVAVLTNNQGIELVPYKKWKIGNNQRPFWLYTMDENGWVASDGIKANTPYIICMPNNDFYTASYNQSGDIAFRASNVIVKASDNISNIKCGHKIFVPNYQCYAQSTDIFALNVNNLINKYTDSDPLEGSAFIRDLRNVKPFEAYMMINGGGAATRTISIFGDDDATGIMDLPLSSDHYGNNKVYTLSGRLIKQCKNDKDMQNLPKGVYIVNGKKVIK